MEIIGEFDIYIDIHLCEIYIYIFVIPIIGSSYLETFPKYPFCYPTCAELKPDGTLGRIRWKPWVFVDHQTLGPYHRQLISIKVNV